MSACNGRNRAEAVAFYSQFLRPGDLCFDVGANRGNRTELFVETGARVIAIEPQPHCAETLRRRFAGHSRITVIPAGLGSESCVRPLFVCEQADTISTFAPKWQTGRFSSYRWNSSLSVPVTTLDALISQFGSPQFCKIDVEGSELDVLQGLSVRIAALAFEFTREFLQDAVRCGDYLQSLGVASFNYTREEILDFALSDWGCAEKLFAALEQEPDPLSWGDIYVRFSADVPSK